MLSKPIIWNLEQGRALIQQLQPLTREFGYHLTLGGGVLNTGASTKDLDLFFLPMEGQEFKRQWMMNKLHELWGAGENLHGSPDYERVGCLYPIKWKFMVQGKRVDVFIL